MNASTGGSSTVSAIVPVRDGEAFILEAIDSVLAQTRPPDEVIVVDDGSRDATADIVARYPAPVRLVRQDPQNQSIALNRGIDEATGGLLSFCDADDLWPADKLEQQVEALAQHPECLLATGLVQQFVSPEAVEATRNLRVDTRPTAALLTGTLVARRAVFERVGRFAADLHLVSGMEWMARARSLGLPVVMVDAVVLFRRVHGQNVSLVERDRKNRDLLVALRAHRRRTRAPAAEG